MVVFNFKLIILTFGLIVSINGFETYKGYRIYETIPTSRIQADFLYKLTEKNDDFDVLSLTKIPNLPARIMIPPKLQNEFENELNLNNMKFNIINSDISNLILMEKIQNNLRSSKPRNILEKFYTYEEINSYLDELSTKYSNRVNVKDEGKSYEGRTIRSITITNGNSNGDNKKVIFVDAGIHAREWIAPSAALYIIHQLVENFEENKNLLEEYDWIIVPLVNPDGYAYTHNKARFWRKTRKPSSSSCFGTDGNRNYDFHWGEIGASASPCQETFRGEKPFSEPETQIIRDILLSLTGHGKMYLTLHSYGNLLLYPWGYTEAYPETWEDLDEVCKAGANAIRTATGTRYTVGSSTNVLYAAAGGSDDYALGVAEIPIAVTMELPSGGSGFDPRPKQIKLMVEETWIGIKAMAEKVIKKY